MKNTKELARELGFLRRHRTVSSSSNKNGSRTCQVFPYLIVLDFESTCWQDKKFRTQEIIEFPAVLLNTTNGNIESEFQYYVQPEEQPILSEFCRELTGITQNQVDEGIPLRLCLKKFTHWLNKLHKEKGISLCQRDEGKKASIVTWSDWDLGVCLFNEVRRKQLLKPALFNSWIDLRATYRKFYNRRPNGLNGALQDVGIFFEGRQHSGLDDARNTAKLAWRMICDGCILNTTKTISRDSKIPSGVNIPAQVRVGTSNEQSSPSKSPYHKRRKMNSDSPISVVQTAEVLKPSKIPVATPPRLARKSPKVKQASKSVVDQIYHDPANKTPTNCSAGNKSTCGLKFRDTNTKNIPGPNKKDPKLSSSGKLLQGSLGSVVKAQMTPITNNLRGSSLRTPAHVGSYNQSTFKTPNTLMSFNQSTLKTPNNLLSLVEVKITPPLCNCGKRSKRRTVQSPGPNIGRFFFSCPNGSQHGSKGCGFFKWETKCSPNVSVNRSGSVSKPFKQVCAGSSQRRSLGVRNSFTRPGIRF